MKLHLSFDALQRSGSLLSNFDTINCLPGLKAQSVSGHWHVAWTYLWRW